MYNFVPLVERCEGPTELLPDVVPGEYLAILVAGVDDHIGLDVESVTVSVMVSQLSLGPVPTNQLFSFLGLVPIVTFSPNGTSPS